MFVRVSLLALGLLASPFPLIAAPEDVSGLVLHLSASSLVALKNGDPVANWTAKASGTPVVFSAKAAPPRYKADGINGQPAVEFAEGTEFLQSEALPLGSDQGLTVIVVCRPQQAIGRLAWQPGSWSVRGTQFNVQPGTKDKVMQDIKATWLSKFGEKLNGQAFCLAGVAAPGQPSVAYINGEIAARSRESLPEFAPSDAVVIVGNDVNAPDGARDQFALRGEIAEVLVYDRALTEPELKDIQNDFNSKYGLVPLNLR